jgi:PhzF family phenazine biosynthesis protein
MSMEGSKRVRMYQVDAFTDVPFRGNPAAVCLMEEDLDDAVLQAIAAENNLSETAFVWPAGGGPHLEANEFQIRWFTPTVEVPLCGHATLATSAVLFDAIGYPREEIRYHSLSGPLTAKRHIEGILLDFPADEVAPIEPPEGLIEAMGMDDVEESFFAKRGKDFMLLVDSPDTVRRMRPAFGAMVRSTAGMDVNGAMVTSRGEPPVDFISRFFAPWLGIDEDPVTGAAHTVLTPYWAGRLGKKVMRAHQASSRGGDLTVELTEEGRVHLIGEAVIVLEGTMVV